MVRGEPSSIIVELATDPGLTDYTELMYVTFELGCLGSASTGT